MNFDKSLIIINWERMRYAHKYKNYTSERAFNEKRRNVKQKAFVIE